MRKERLKSYLLNKYFYYYYFLLSTLYPSRITTASSRISFSSYGRRALQYIEGRRENMYAGLFMSLVTTWRMHSTRKNLKNTNNNGSKNPLWTYGRLAKNLALISALPVKSSRMLLKFLGPIIRGNISVFFCFLNWKIKKNRSKNRSCFEDIVDKILKTGVEELVIFRLTYNNFVRWI